MIRRIFQLVRSKIVPRSPLTANVEVGSGFRYDVGSFVWAPVQLKIGKNVSIGSNVRIEVDGVIGDAVMIANSTGIVGRNDHEIGVVGVPVTEGKWVGKFPNELSVPIKIGSDVWIGYGSTILSGVEIGDSSVIGAGSVVVNNIPSNSIAVGNPARVVGKRFQSDADFDEHWVILANRGFRKIAP